MMRTDGRVTIGVSLKMYLDHEETLAWSRSVADIARRHGAIVSGDADLVVFPSFTALQAVLGIFEGTRVGVGAQDVFWEDRGAYTGEVSAVDLRQLGCSHAEIGHAERKRIFGETEVMVAAKVAAALRNGLAPVVCVGEPDRVPALDAAEQCLDQLQAALVVAEGERSGGSMVVAYEPEWAIGAEEAADPEHIATVCRIMRAWIEDHPLLAPSRVIYGGSAGPGLLTTLGRSVDGLFLGRFAHDPVALERVLDESSALAGRPA